MKIQITNDGSHTLVSEEFGALYHSSHGSFQEAKHIFIDHGLSQINKKEISVFEMGFGSGLNAILTYYYARVLRGIEKVATEKGYNLITCITNESYKKEVHTMEMLSNGTIDGFIACISEETLRLGNFDHFKAILEEDTPIVLYDRVHKDIHCDKVVTDNIKSAYKATRFLMRSECKNIALISTSEGLAIGKFRVEGY